MKRSGRKSKSPAFQWYPTDYRANRKTQRFAALEAGVFHLLLDEQWLEGPLPNDLDTLALICGMSRAEFDAVWPRVAPCFPAGQDGRLASPRLERERELQAEFSGERRQSGLAGNAKRWGGDPTGVAHGSLSDRSAIPQASLHVAPHSPYPIPHTPHPSNTTPLPPPAEGETDLDPAPVEATHQRRSKREQTPEQKAKAAEMAMHREAGKAVWQAAWEAHRTTGDPFEFAGAHVAPLRKMHAKHGAVKLRSKCDALLSDLDPWTFEHASPTLLAARWSQLGIAAPRVRKLSETERNTQAVLAAVARQAGGAA